MKKFIYVFISFVIFLILASITFFLSRILLKPVLCPEKAKGTVVIWNRTDVEITVMVHSKNNTPQPLEVAAGSRACIGLGAKDDESEELDPIKYIAIFYEGKKYKFIASELLNTFYGVTEQMPWPTRYFAIMHATHDHGEWESLKTKGKKHDLKLSDKSDYLILSNYKKIGDVLDEDAIMGAVKVRKKNICEKR